MANRRDGGWEVDTLYSQEQIEAVLAEIGIQVESEDGTNLYHYCPFHGNTDSPSFTVSKEKGLYHCYNPACSASGTILELVMKIGRKNPFEAARMVAAKKTATALSFEDRLAREMMETPEWTPFSQDALARLYEDFWTHDEAVEYMHGRGFVDETLKHFRVGYSQLRDSIAVPMHSPDGLPIGIIGRSLKGKDFKNSKGLPKNLTAWNFHRAKREGDTVIICEASFDAMRIHQAGYPNVVALLGGSFSIQQQAQLGRSFNSVVIMTDWDDPSKHFNTDCNQCRREGSNLCRGHNPGEVLGKKIATAMQGKRVLWAHHGGVTRFPPGIKDAGDMSDYQIRHCISNAVSNLEYNLDV